MICLFFGWGTILHHGMHFFIPVKYDERVFLRMNGDGRCALIGQNRIVYHTNKPLLSYKSNELHVHLPDYVIVMLS